MSTGRTVRSPQVGCCGPVDIEASVTPESTSCCAPADRSGLRAEEHAREGFRPVYSGWVSAAAKYAMYAPAAESASLRDPAGNMKWPLPGPSLVTEVVQEAKFDEGRRVLEAAASLGHIATIAARIIGPGGEAVLGQLDRTLIRPAEAYIAQCGLQSSVKVVEADKGRIPFPDSYFDAVVSDRAACCLFSTLDGQQKFMEELVRVTKPNGRVVIVEAVPLKAPPRGRRIPGCIANTTVSREPEKVVGMLRQAGLESISIRRMPNSKAATKEMCDAAGVPAEDGYVEFAILSGTRREANMEEVLQSIRQTGEGCCRPLDED